MGSRHRALVGLWNFTRPRLARVIVQSHTWWQNPRNPRANWIRTIKHADSTPNRLVCNTASVENLPTQMRHKLFIHFFEVVLPPTSGKFGAMSFSKTTLALSRTVVQRPSPGRPSPRFSYTVFSTPTSVVPATFITCPPWAESLSHSLDILLSSNEVDGASKRRRMSLDVISSINARSKRSASSLMVSIRLAAFALTKSNGFSVGRNDPVIDRTSAMRLAIEKQWDNDLGR